MRCAFLQQGLFIEQRRELQKHDKVRCASDDTELRIKGCTRKKEAGIFWRLATIEGVRHSLEVVNDELIDSRLQRRMERARDARQFAEQCRLRAAMLIAQATLLLERFDELERRMLSKKTNARRRIKGPCFKDVMETERRIIR